MKNLYAVFIVIMSMNNRKKIGTILKAGLFSLLLFLSSGAQAAPLLLAMEKNTAPDSIKADGALYALNIETAAQLWQKGSFIVTLPVIDQEVEFRQTERLVRKKNLTWKGVDSSGLLTALLTLSTDHVYGQIFGTFGVVKITPEASNQIRVKLLDPAQETVVEHDMLLPPVSALDSDTASVTKMAEDGSRIDVMVLYTDGMEAAHPGEQINTLIQNLIDQSNLVFSNSAINTQFNLVHAKRVMYPDDNSLGGMSTVLRNLTDNIGVFSDLEELRTVYGADQVVLLRQYVDEGCGMAWVLQQWSAPRSAYAVVHVGNKTDGSRYYCPDITYIHEIGHNLGCAHDRANAGVSGRYDYSYGYQSPSATFRTVMAYNCSGGCPQVLYFSNPDLQYNGQALGVLHTANDSADNARTINQTRVEMANYRAAVETAVWTVTPNAGPGGSISPDTVQSVNHGTTMSFTISPNTGYKINTVNGCGGSLNGNIFTTGAITANCSVTASFKERSVLIPVYNLLL